MQHLVQGFHQGWSGPDQLKEMGPGCGDRAGFCPPFLNQGQLQPRALRPRRGPGPVVDATVAASGVGAYPGLTMGWRPILPPPVAVTQKRPASRRWGMEQRRVPGQDGVIARSAVPMARRLAWMMSLHPWLGCWRRYRAAAATRWPSRTSPSGGSSLAAAFAWFCPFRSRRGCLRNPLRNKKDPLHRKESDEMEPSGFEPLTPCMPCRCSTS